MAFISIQKLNGCLCLILIGPNNVPQTIAHSKCPHKCETTIPGVKVDAMDAIEHIEKLNLGAVLGL